jgi:CDGSH-type Zn-finger protein
MTQECKNPKIKITKDGPYLVSGNVPLTEKIIVPQGNGYVYQEGRELPQEESYALCRCGHSTNPPFCDGKHVEIGFNGTETASRRKFEDRAQRLVGPGLDLLDDRRCALARFCHREKGTAWELTECSGEEESKAEAIIAASECPAGRLVAVEKTGELIEPLLEPSIEILQDPEKGVSSAIFVKGNIPMESADGEIYEVRNRMTLCRCGSSRTKPFCDAAHISVRFTDKK